LGELTGLSPGESESFLQRHLGVCFDACHMTAEFEEPESAFRALDRVRAARSAAHDVVLRLEVPPVVLSGCSSRVNRVTIASVPSSKVQVFLIIKVSTSRRGTG